MADVNSSGAKAGMVISPNPAALLMVAGRNVSATDIYVQLHNAVSAPSDGAAAILTVKVLAGENFSIVYPVTRLTTGRKFSTGIYICSSTTETTKTLSASNDITFDAQVEELTR